MLFRSDDFGSQFLNETGDGVDPDETGDGDEEREDDDFFSPKSGEVIYTKDC